MSAPIKNLEKTLDRIRMKHPEGHPLLTRLERQLEILKVAGNTTAQGLCLSRKPMTEINMKDFPPQSDLDQITQEVLEQFGLAPQSVIAEKNILADISGKHLSGEDNNEKIPQRILAESEGTTLAAAADVARRVRQKGKYTSWTETLAQIEREEDTLISWADEKNLLIDDPQALIDNYDRSGKIDGAEHFVYIEDNGKTVVKIAYGFAGSPLEYLEALIIHNYYFPETRYELCGYAVTEASDGSRVLWPVVEQPAVVPDTDFANNFSYNPDKNSLSDSDLEIKGRIDLMMEARGFKPFPKLTKKELALFPETSRYHDFFDVETGVMITDLHKGNLVKLDGFDTYTVIDSLINVSSII